MIAAMARKTPWETYSRWRKHRWRRFGTGLALWAMTLQVLLPLVYPIAAQAFGNDRVHDIVILTVTGEKQIHLPTASPGSGHDHHGHQHAAAGDTGAASSSADEHHDRAPKCSICVVAKAIATGPLPTPAASIAAPERTSDTFLVLHDDQDTVRYRLGHQARAPPS